MEGLLKSIDGFCARLNAGLAAVALVLAILVAAQLSLRIPNLYQQAIDAQTASFAASNPALGY
ncbi:MAG: hypothetical protein ACREFL_18565 [Stellaceae bacterium]